ncbi:MAG: HAD family hydrolase [Chloroflexi bacterium]|nr:HAD family hydrolase [Chloroflexota bacterium]
MSDRLKGLLFDFDDTLIDWSGVQQSWYELEAPRLRRVHAYVCSRANNSNINARQLIDLYQERTMQAWTEARQSLIAPHMPDILFTALKDLGFKSAELDLDEVIRAYNWNVVPGTVVFPDVLPMLEALASAGVKLGIVTNSSQPMALRDAELAGHGLLDYFPDCRLAAADTGYLKPHPRMFEAALSEMGTAPGETVFIGDNPKADIAGALAVGMRAVQRINHRAFDSGIPGIQPNSQRVFPGWENMNWRASLRSLDELPAILREWYPDWRNGSP